MLFVTCVWSLLHLCKKINNNNNNNGQAVLDECATSFPELLP